MTEQSQSMAGRISESGIRGIQILVALMVLDIWLMNRGAEPLGAEFYDAFVPLVLLIVLAPLVEMALKRLMGALNVE